MHFGNKLLNVFIYVGSFFHILTKNPYTNMENKGSTYGFWISIEKDKMQQSDLS